MNNYHSPAPQRRINERLRRRRRRRAVTVIILLLAILLALAAIYVGLLLRGRTPGNETDVTTPEITDALTTTAPVPETTAPTDTTAVTTPEETMKPPAPIVVYKKVTLTRADMVKGDLIVVNSTYPYTFPATEKHLTRLYGNKSRGYQLGSANDMLESNALAAWNRAADAFLAETEDTYLILTNNGGYRSYATQEKIYQNRVNSVGEAEAQKYVALPGNSEHHTGLAFDLGVYRDGKMYSLSNFDVYDWIPRNLPRYGYILRYPADKVNVTGISYEEWHFRYVGIPHAVYMTEQNLCLEEYMNILRAHQADGNHLFVETDGVKYEIWYVPFAPEGDVTEVSVPENVPYSISGNNMDGFVVTLTHPAE